MQKNPKIVVIGGGTGTFVVLSGLKKYIKELVAIVSMADSGGCNKVIRDEFGLLPTSDIRQCFVALASGGSQTERLMRKLFMYRFNKGTSFKGMTFGNLFMAALADILGSQYLAIKKTGEVLRISGSVIPVTMDKVELVAKYEDGKTVKGEHHIDQPKLKDAQKRIIDLWVEPKAKASAEVVEQIKKADYIILGPGDLFTSTLPNLVIKQVGQAVRESKAKIIFIVNLMTKAGQTFGYTAFDHIIEIKKYLGRQPDFIFLNKAKIPDQVCRRYWREEKAIPVADDLSDKNGYKVIRGDFLSSKIYRKPAGDILRRSLIRHESVKLAEAILNLLK